MQERSDDGGFRQVGQPPQYQPPQQWSYAPPARTKPRRGRMIAACAGSLVVGLIIGYGAGHSSTKTTPDASPIVTSAATSAAGGQAPAAATSAPTSPATSAPAKSAPAKIGDSITLAGQNGEKVTVTVVKVTDPAKPSDQYMTPDAGNRFVAVQLRFVNAGTVAYSDSVDNGAVLIDAAGQSFSAEPYTTTAGPGFATGEVTIAPGATGLGWITFQMPTASKVASIQVGLDSGFSQKGQWALH